MKEEADKTIFLYDPRTNIITATTYDYLEQLTGKKLSNLRSLRSKGKRINNINCYLLRDDTTVKQRKEWYEKEKYHNEVWKTIKGSDDKFLVSNYGRFKRVYKNKTKFLLPVLNKKRGHLEIKAMYNGVYKGHKVANLVAVHFIGTPRPGEVIRHKNGIKTDDYFANLEYVSKRELGVLTGYKAKSKPVVQLDPATGEIINEFRSAREAGRQTNFSHQAIVNRCNNVFPYKNDDFIFMFCEDYENREERA